MSELEPGAKVAKDLGIYLGQIYGYIKRGLVTNHKEGGYPVGKGIIVDPDEVKAAKASSRRKSVGPGKGKTSAKSGPTRRELREGAADTLGGIKRGAKLKVGDIVSYEQGRASNASEAGKPHYSVAQVLGSTGRLTYLDDGDHRVHYTGTQIDNVVFATERLSMMMAKGVARIEKPIHVLGMVLLSFVMEDKADLAQSLEDWMTDNGLEIHVPELLDLEATDEDYEPPKGGQPVTGEEEDE